MERKEAVRKCRKGLLVFTVALFVIVLGTIIIALTPSGNWITVEQTSPVEIERNGANLDMSFSVEVASKMPYDINGMDITLTLFDHARGSAVPLYKEEGITIFAHRTTELTIEASVWMPTAALVIRDLAMKDGAPLHLDLTAQCSYLAGMASFMLVSEIEVPVTAEGEKLTYSVPENTSNRFIVKIDGLADWLVPDDWTAIVSGGGEKTVLSVTGSGSTALLSVVSDSVLDGALGRIASTEDYMAVDENGTEIDLDPDALRTIDSILQYARDVL